MSDKSGERDVEHIKFAGHLWQTIFDRHIEHAGKVPYTDSEEKKHHLKLAEDAADRKRLAERKISNMRKPK